MSACPHCAAPVFRKNESGTKRKARVKILVLHSGGELETNCPNCGRGILLPVQVDEEKAIRKATPQKLFVGGAQTRNLTGQK